MKLYAHSRRFFPLRCRRESGSAIVVILFLLSLIVALMAINSAALGGLSRELRLLEKRHELRWTPRTNRVATASVEPPGASIKRALPPAR